MATRGSRWTRRVVLASLASLPVLATDGLAQGTKPYPDRPIRLLVPYAPGGGTDAVARLVANGVGERLGQTMVVENNGAAGGNIASQQAAGAPKDGYTVLMANQGPMVVNPHIFKNLRVDPLTAFDPVTQIADTPLVLVVPKASRFKSVQELLAFGKANPGKLTFASPGNGSAGHLATVLLAQASGLQAVHVPYRGAQPALTDLMGGNSDFLITTLPSVIGLVDGKEMIPLAVTTTTRSRRLPDVPTLAELGFPEVAVSAWYGFVVPKGTPADIVATLRKATIEAVSTGTVRERFAAEGAEPALGGSPDSFAAMMAAESQRWANVVRRAGITVD